jgi:hypothetical protein
VAWKILRGAVEASTKSVTVGGVEAQVDSGNVRRQTTPKIFESFIFRAPMVNELTALGRM